ncbi:MAG TPA: flagellar basal body P-ring protein FlgI [Sedimentisphaerales bacterium]|nr:flagellar basal body P-ring protein FlgI [Sedimentisphaerales bacterium]
MKTVNLKILCVLAAMSIVGLGGGCDEAGRMGGRSKLLDGPTDLGTTIGSLAAIYSPESVAVEGYGLVGGLDGTGSSECPPSIRAYLKRYISKQVPDHRINVDKLIDSVNTAVVQVVGQVPSLEAKERRFDVVVGALAGTQTTSLEGGWLYGAELRVAGRMGAAAMAVGNVAGPVFTDPFGGLAMSKRMGYVLGGAEVFDDYRISVVLKKPVFEVANNVRNRINERFGFDVAKAVTPGRIELTVPPKYAGQRQRFVSLVEATYMTENPEITAQRISTHIRELAASQNKYPGEIALEAIGNESLGKLSVLLNSSSEDVRLHAARCMLSLGGDEALSTLIEIAVRTGSNLRVEALDALTDYANRSDAAAILRRLLGDSDFGIRIAAYERLLRLEDVSVSRESVGRSFYLDEVEASQYKGIYVSRSGQPRIALFGTPIRCRENVFVQSEDGTIILNAPRGQNFVSVVRRQPRLGAVVGDMRSSHDLADIIRVLCSEPNPDTRKGRQVGGLGVSYSQMIALVKQLSDKGAVGAEFRAGPMPKIGVNIKK